MGRDAFVLVEEYWTHSEAIVRRNAAIAFAALGSAEAFEHVAKMAVSDADAGVRKRAELELSRALSVPASADGAANALGRQLDSDEKTQKSTVGLATYDLLGRLPRPPLRQHLAPRTIGQRFEFVASLHQLNGVLESAGERTWIVMNALIADALGCVALFLLCLVVRGQLHGDVIAETGGGAALQLPWVLLVSVRATPSSAHFYSTEVRVVECLRATVLGGLFALPFVAGEEGFFASILYLAISAGAVRAGVYAGVIPERPALSRYWSALTGSAAGVLTLSALLTLHASEAAQDLWGQAVVLGCGMAAAFARMEGEVSQQRRPSSVAIGFVLSSLLGLSVFAVVVGGLRGSPRSLEPMHWSAREPERIAVPVGQTRVIAALPTHGVLHAEVSGRLVDAEGCTMDYPANGWQCEAGNVTLTVREARDIQANEVFDLLKNAALQRLSPTTHTLDLRFVPTPAPSPPTP
jgi:hypothetical protein